MWGRGRWRKGITRAQTEPVRGAEPDQRPLAAAVGSALVSPDWIDVIADGARRLPDA